MVVIDIFGTFAVVVPIKSKLQDDVLARIIEGIKNGQRARTHLFG